MINQQELEQSKFNDLLKQIKDTQNNKQEQLAQLCPETKVILWDNQQFDQFQAEYLNQIYPQKLSKATVSDGVQFHFHFLSSSLNYWVEIVQNKVPEPNKISKKDIRFIKDELKSTDENTIERWSEYFDNRENFQKMKKQQQKSCPPGTKCLYQYERDNLKFEVYHLFGNDPQLIPYKQKFEILLLLFVDGASFSENQQDWQYYLIYKIHNNRRHFVGLLSKYVFKITHNKQRHRISQVLILPPYQKQGHGKVLLDLVYSESLECDRCFEITVEGPSYQFQCLRDYKQAQMLINLGFYKNVNEDIKVTQQSIQLRKKLLSIQRIRQVKKKLKLPGHQIERITNIIIYSLLLKSNNQNLIESFEQGLRNKIINDRSAFKTRQKKPFLFINGQQLDSKMFLLQKQKQDFLRNKNEIETIIKQNLDGMKRVINKLKKQGII